MSHTGLKNPELEACIIKVIEAIEFPKPKGGGTVSVMCPLVFKKPK